MFLNYTYTIYDENIINNIINNITEFTKEHENFTSYVINIIINNINYEMYEYINDEDDNDKINKSGAIAGIVALCLFIIGLIWCICKTG